MSQAIYSGHTTPDQDARLLAAIEEVAQRRRDIADAARWRYVRDHLTQGIGPHMDGTWQFRFLSLFERGQTVEEAIDAQIAQFRV